MRVEVNEAAARQPPGLARALGRGLVRRCPRCGGGGIFRRWLAMSADCPTCGLHFERLDGYWLGSMALNIVVTEALFVAALVVMMAVTWPEVPWTLVLIVLMAMNFVVPLVFHPISRTIWMAVERQLSGIWE